MGAWDAVIDLKVMKAVDAARIRRRNIRGVQDRINAGRQRDADNAALRELAARRGDDIFGRPQTAAAATNTATAAGPEIPELTRVSFNTRDFKRETGTNTTDTFVFPDVLNNGDLPYIRFDVFEVVTGAVAPDTTVATPTAASLNAGFRQAGGIIAKTTESALETAKSIAGNTISRNVAEGVSSVGEAAGVTAGKVGISVDKLKGQIKSLFQDFSLSRYKDVRALSLILPIPEGLNTSYGQDYGEISLTKELGTIGFVAQALAEPKFLDRNDPYIAELTSRLAQESPLGRNFSEDLVNILRFGSTGKVVNPQMEMLYKTPQFREFTFDFRLIPRNARDALEIKKIIQQFKYHSSPQFCGSTTGRYYTPPSKFSFRFFTNGSNQNYNLFESKQCVITNISIDYAPNSYATHADGVPVETRLQIILKETAMITADDIYIEGSESGGFY